MHYVCRLADLVQLEPRLFSTDAGEIAVVRIGDEVFAFDARCTHKPGPLAAGAVTRKRTLLCPWHLGTFDLKTGAVLAGPPKEPLQTHRVHLRDGDLYLD